jgi:hypothetical protein
VNVSLNLKGIIGSESGFVKHIRPVFLRILPNSWPRRRRFCSPWSFRISAIIARMPRPLSTGCGRIDYRGPVALVDAAKRAAVASGLSLTDWLSRAIQDRLSRDALSLPRTSRGKGGFAPVRSHRTTDTGPTTTIAADPGETPETAEGAETILSPIAAALPPEGIASCEPPAGAREEESATSGPTSGLAPSAVASDNAGYVQPAPAAEGRAVPIPTRVTRYDT